MLLAMFLTISCFSANVSLSDICHFWWKFTGIVLVIAFENNANTDLEPVNFL